VKHFLTKNNFQFGKVEEFQAKIPKYQLG